MTEISNHEFPNYTHSIVDSVIRGLVHRYILDRRYLTNIHGMSDGIAYTVCPVCGADLPVSNTVVSVPYDCDCKTHIYKVGPTIHSKHIVVWFDIQITDFELREDDTI